MNTDCERHEIIWDDTTIEIVWQRDYLGCTTEKSYLGHLEIRSLNPEDAPLPITRTGYRSHFIHEDELGQHGGPLTYVEMWLEQEAQTEDWLERKAAYNQMALF